MSTGPFDEFPRHRVIIVQDPSTSVLDPVEDSKKERVRAQKNEAAREKTATVPDEVSSVKSDVSVSVDSEKSSVDEKYAKQSVSSKSAPVQVPARKHRTRIAERLATAVEISSKDEDRSDELEELKKRYHEFVQKIGPFPKAIQQYHDTLVKLEEHRTKMIETIELFTEGTPLADAGATSFCKLEEQEGALNQHYAYEFREYCIEYVREWFIVVKARLDMNLQKADELQKTWKHYEKKVQQLVNAEARMSSRGKTVDQNTQDKLVRNQEKLAVAKTEFVKYATSTCHLLDAALDGAWNDMTPVVYHLVRMAQERRGDSQSKDALALAFKTLVDSLQKFATENEIDLVVPVTPRASSKANASTSRSSKASKKTTPKRWFSN